MTKHAKMKICEKEPPGNVDGFHGALIPIA